MIAKRPAFRHERATLEQADAFEWLGALPPDSVDLIITDPPYESMEKHRARGTTTRLKQSKASSNEWFDVIPNAKLLDLCKQAYRVLKPNTHFYLFCDQETMFYVKPVAEMVGFTFHKPLVWDKATIGMGYHYRSRYEFILFFSKGKRRLNDLSIPDILIHKRIRGGYPAEKPVGIIRTLVTQSANEGELVVDPFFGSGSTAMAAVGTKRRFAGCDSNPRALQHATESLRLLFDGAGAPLTVPGAAELG